MGTMSDPRRMEPRSLDAGIALSLAVGRVLLPGAGEADRGALTDAVAAVPPGADGPAGALAQAASAWLSGALDGAGLRAALDVFCAPYCRRRASANDHRGLVEGDQRPLFPPTLGATHAARVAEHMED